MANIEQSACEMAAGVSRNSWASLCKVGLPTPELLQMQAESTLRLAATAQEKFPHAVVMIALDKGVDVGAGGAKGFAECLKAGWQLYGFYVAEDKRCVYAEVVGPCTNPTGAPGRAEIMTYAMDERVKGGHCDVRLPDGNDFEFDDSQWVMFRSLVG